jgi:hypothetical protein
MYWQEHYVTAAPLFDEFLKSTGNKTETYPWCIAEMKPVKHQMPAEVLLLRKIFALSLLQAAPFEGKTIPCYNTAKRIS